MTHDDIDEIHSIELEVYDTIYEVPTKLFKRRLLEVCPELCMVARDENNEIIVGTHQVNSGYGGLIDGTSISMHKINKGHNPGGDTLFV